MTNKQMSMPGSHDEIIKIMASMPIGKVLDSPAGSGALAKRLTSLGFEVSCCDIDGGNFHLHDQFQLTNADFNQDKLPYPDNEFDYVICANGLHRLYYPSNALKEFDRIVKSGGKMILSWPNYNSLARRLRFLITGSIGESIDFASYDQTIAEPAAKIRYPLSTGRVEFLLKKVGISMHRVTSIGYRFYDYPLIPLAAIIAGLTKIIGIGSKDNRLSVICGGSTTIVVCKKGL
jgi:SAM-dependent methyltransferase